MSLKHSKLSPRRQSIDKSVVKNAKILKERPEFTTLTKINRKASTGTCCDEKKIPCPSSPSRRDSLKVIAERKASMEELPIETRRDKMANSYTYESILHDQVVSLKALLIRTQAAATSHDDDAIMAYVGERAEVCRDPFRCFVVI